jgi:PAS domain S-box-containing protein
MSKTKIMIVEDEWAIAEDLKHSLETLEYEVTSIEETGEGAIRKAEKDMPDLVLMDIILRENTSGIDAASQIHSHLNIPHIFISAYANEEMLAKAMITEPFGYLLKPFDEKELHAAIEMALYKHNMETRLRESERSYRTLAENIPGLVYRLFMRENKRIKFFSKTGETLTGYKESDLQGGAFCSLEPFIHPDDRENVVTEIQQAIEARRFFSVEYRFRHGDGIYRYFMDNGSPIMGDDGELLYIEGIIWDITARKHAEALIQNQHELLNNVMESLTHPFYVINIADYTIDFANSAACPGGLTERTTCHYMSHHSNEPCRDKDHPCTIELIKETKKAVSVEHTHYDSDGNPKIVEVNAYPLFDNNGNLTQIIEYNFDITDRKEAEAAREELNRELSQIIFITSHDLRTPLVNIDGYSKEVGYSFKELKDLLDSNDVPPSVREKIAPVIEKDIPGSLHYISNSIARMDKLLAGMLKLSRTGRAELIIEDIDMNDIVIDVINNLKARLSEAGIITEISELPSCRGDKTQINQVFSNIIGNAVKYIDPDRAGIIKIAGRRQGRKSVYCMEDNGIGIAPEYQDKIFEIFLQLNPSKSEGEGLGLTIVHKILNRLGGRVWVESEAGKGSKFFVSLPAK